MVGAVAVVDGVVAVVDGVVSAVVDAAKKAKDMSNKEPGGYNRIEYIASFMAS